MTRRTERSARSRRASRRRGAAARTPTARSGGSHTPSTDLDSFAVVAAELATGRPFQPRDSRTRRCRSTSPDRLGTIRTIPFYKVLRGHVPAERRRRQARDRRRHLPRSSKTSMRRPHSEGMPGPEIWANAIVTLLRGVPLTRCARLAEHLADRPARTRGPAGQPAPAPVAFAAGRARAGHRVHDRHPARVQHGADLDVRLSAARACPRHAGDARGPVYGRDDRARACARSVRALRARRRGRRGGGAAPTRTCASAPSSATARSCSATCAGSRASPRQQPAERVIEVVNCYLNEMTEAILGAGGTLISYMGDGIMAVFGAPLEQPDHADRALAAAKR